MKSRLTRQAEVCRPEDICARPPHSGWTIQPRELFVVGAIVAIWVLVAFVIDPRGEFPLNDDWCYAATVKALREGAGLRLTGCSSTNIVAQVFWGALFCLPFGFSFAALRISTLTLGLAGVLGLYGLLREADADAETSLFGALLLALNPFYLGLSYTFMPDVPFVAFSIFSFYFLARGMKRNSRLAIAAGILLASVALLIRQTGLAIFVAFGVAYLAKTGLRLRNILLASVPVAFGGMLQLVWQLWLEHQHIGLGDYSTRAGRVPSAHAYFSWHSIMPFAGGVVVTSVYLGLFLLPILLFVGRRGWAEFSRSRWANLATLAFAVLSACVLRHRRMPLLPNVLYDFGLGPTTLHDTFVLGLPSLPTAGRMFWFVITFIGVIGALLLAQATFAAVARARKPSVLATGKRELPVVLVMLLAGGLIYAAPVAMLSIKNWAFDRYLLLLVPIATALVVLLVSNASTGAAGFATRALAAATLILYAAFSIAGTHDYLSWNRARWQALNNLMTEQRISADDIDGGYEFNGWYRYDSNYVATPDKSWWWVFEDDYMVTFGPVPDFTEMKRYPFRRWLPPGQGNILVLQKTTSMARR